MICLKFHMFATNLAISFNTCSCQSNGVWRKIKQLCFQVRNLIDNFHDRFIANFGNHLSNGLWNTATVIISCLNMMTYVKSGKVWREIFTAVGHIGIFYFKKICCLLESQFTIEHTCLSCIGGSSLSFWNCLILVSSTSACWIKKEYAISIMDKLSVWYELAVWNRWFACSRWMTNYVPKFIFGWFIYQHILKTCRHTNQLFPIALFMFHLKSPPGSHVHVIAMH